MRRWVVLAVLVGMGLGAGARSAAGEDDTPAASMVTLPQASLDTIYKKLDSIRRHQDELKDVSKKLDQVLKNQEAILAELEIVKVRATRK